MNPPGPKGSSASTCHRCCGARRIGQLIPGAKVVYCSARADLPPAYGPGHPLRRLPRGLGADCDRFTEREAA